MSTPDFNSPIEAIVDRLPVGVFVLRSGYEIVLWNTRLEEWTGIKRDEACGQTLADFLPHLMHPRYTSRLDDLFAGGPPAVFSPQLHREIVPARGWDGRPLIQKTTASAVYDRGGQPHVMLVIEDMTDVTGRIQQAMDEVQERRRTEERLRQSEAAQRALISAMTDAILIVDRQGAHLRVIPTRSQINTALTGVDAANGSLYDLLTPEQAMHMIGAIRLALNERKPVFITLDSSDDWLSVAVSPLNDDEVMLVIRDVTASKMAERQSMQLLIEQERAEVLSQFVRASSHDFRTPLSIMATGIYLLRHTKDPQRIEQRLNQLQTQVQVIQHLVDQLLEISQLDMVQHLKVQQTSINSLLAVVEANYTEPALKKGLTLTVQAQEDLPLMQLDPVRLSRALASVVENAIAFTSEGQVTVRAQRSQGQVVILVQDTGSGIVPDRIPRIYDPFYKVDEARSKQEGGLGIGLFIARRIIHAHGGRLNIDSVPDQGTTVTIRLPLHTTMDEAPESAGLNGT